MTDLAANKDDVAVFDTGAVLTKITTALKGQLDEREKRAIVVTHLQTAHSASLAKIADRLLNAPLAAQAATHSYSQLTDCLVRLVYQLATEQFHTAAPPTNVERLTLIAVGGYGRG